MNNWLNQHIQTLKLVLSRMRNNMLSTFMICLVIGVAMCLPSLFYLAVDNLSKLTEHMQKDTEISLFLKVDINPDAIKKIEQQLAKNQDIQRFHLVTKEEAWQQLQVKSKSNQDVNDAVSQLGKNPLPDAFFIQAKSSDPDSLIQLKDTLQHLPNVELALLNTEWVKRLSSLLNLGKKLISMIAGLLAIVLLVIIGNTVRMQILTQKDEIEVSNLIGATRSFIRMPFLYAGALYGLFGGLLAVLMLVGMIQAFNLSMSQIAHLYSNDFSLTLFDAQLFLTVMMSAIGIGWVGSYIAVSRAIASYKIN
ncbi:MAG: permease-like cell division protein FtsX [Methylotenera sp.]|uniref:permease-like cell division protein FtsX n=1 Tax=Methylotenera sp. TaxID=2051956 RepID=UPI0027252BE3|nr:permease-like cell division protein FtsX [Methylotenera sp.]MDO9150078.1 permease-like cell division protein FtsX [Methylotenera sp.]